MKYLVHMDVNLPADLPAHEAAGIKATEKAYSQELQRSGKWPEIWRVVGEYANYSIFDVDSNDELHEILQNLPLFPYMDISVVPLAKHPSDYMSAAALARRPAVSRRQSLARNTAASSLRERIPIFR